MQTAWGAAYFLHAIFATLMQRLGRLLLAGLTLDLCLGVFLQQGAVSVHTESTRLLWTLCDIAEQRKGLSPQEAF